MSKLIIAFDIGTTYSGASYAITTRAKKPLVVYGVNRFTGVGITSEDSKIPSCLLYDDNSRRKEPLCVGAEVDHLERNGSLDGCTKIEWFKLRLGPTSVDIPSALKYQLPYGKTHEGVYADFLKYLHAQTCKYINETDSQAAKLLNAGPQNIRFVLTHPNGWTALHQQQLRKAAQKAGLIQDRDDKRLLLLSEGEASVHYSYHQHNPEIVSALEEGDGFAVIDAGGGTIDISFYERSLETALGSELKLEELAPAKCILHGAIFVTRLAEAYIKRKLQGSEFESEIPTIVRKFDESTKRDFYGPQGYNGFTLVQFGRRGWNDPKHDIVNGAFKIPDRKMVEFFEPTIMAVLQALIDGRKGSASSLIKTALFVGGFAKNEWLYTQLREGLSGLGRGIRLVRPDRHTPKTVSDGAVYFGTNRKVVARVAKFTYGVEIDVKYDCWFPAHVARKDTSTYVSELDGKRYLKGIFSPILVKGTKVHETREFAGNFFLQIPSGDSLPNPVKDEIICYTGPRKQSLGHQQYMDEEPEMYRTVLNYETKLPKEILTAISKIPPTIGPKNHRYIEFYYQIMFSFGTTELEAYTSVTYQKPKARKGTLTTKRFAAKPVPDDEDDEAEDSEDSDD